jgi:hypothetical protein
MNWLLTPHKVTSLGMIERSGLSALSSDDVDVDWESLLPDIWIATHPEHVLTYRRDEAEAEAQTRRRRRVRRRAKTRESSASS